MGRARGLWGQLCFSCLGSLGPRLQKPFMGGKSYRPYFGMAQPCPLGPFLILLGLGIPLP